MKNYLIVLLGLVALGAAAYLLWLRPPHYTNYPPREGPIVAFGDSLVYGTGATEGNDFVSLLSKRLNEDVINLGVPGDTTADALARLNTALALRPGIVLVLLGGNDYLKRIPKEQTFENLRTIVAALQEEGALVVVLGVRGGLFSDNYAVEYRRLAADTRSAYVPNVLDNLLGNRQYMFDQVHPNDDGYAIIAERVFTVLRPLLH